MKNIFKKKSFENGDYWCAMCKCFVDDITPTTIENGGEEFSIDICYKHLDWLLQFEKYPTK